MNRNSQSWLEKLIAKEAQKVNPVEKVSFIKKILLGLFL